jgi:tetratricopeptide (TPR) repeat protein
MPFRKQLFALTAAIAGLSAAIACQAAGQTLAATDELKQIEERLEIDKNQPVTDDMIEQVQAVLANDPQNRDAHMILAQCYDRLGLPDQADQEFTLAVKYSPDDPHALVELVKAEIKSGHPQVAMKMLEAAGKRFPNDAEVMFWYANYLATTNKTKEATALYKIALEHNAKILGLASALGQLRLEDRRFGDAVQLANQDLALDKNFVLAYRVKGFALAFMSRWSEAQEPLRIAYKEQPFKGGVAYMYAKACAWSGDYQDALEPALVALAVSSNLETNNYEQKVALARILRNVPRDKAIAKIGIVSNNLDLSMPNPAFHFALGDVLDRADMHDTAIEQYHKGLQMAPNFARAIFRLGKDMELYKQQYKEALFCYTRAHELAPQDAEIDAYYQRLRQRLEMRNEDVAWRLKDWIASFHL